MTRTSTGGHERRWSALKRSKPTGELCMATNPLPRDFRDFLKLLEDENVDYLLIGGYAVGYYGYPRATADMDVWIAVNPANAAKMVRALERFGMKTPEITI